MAQQTEAAPTAVKRVPGIFPSYLAPIDQFFLDDDAADYPMTYVIRMECRGAFDRPVLEDALAGAVERHPLVGAMVRPAKQNRPCWVAPDGPGVVIDWGADAEPINCPVEQIDLSKEVGLRIWVRQGDERALVVFQFQHAVCDGTGAFRFIGDLLALYDQRVGGDASRMLDLDPRLLRERRGRMAKVYTSGSTWQMLGACWRQFRTVFMSRSAPLAPPATSPPTKAFPGIVVETFSRDETATLRSAADAAGVMLNDLLISSFFLAVRQWNEQRGQPSGAPLRILMPTDLRESSETEMPAANFVAYTFLDRKARDCDDPTALLESIAKETAQIKYAAAGVDFIDAISAAENRPWVIPWLLRRSRCLSTAVLTNNGDPARRMTARLPKEKGRLKAGGIVVERFSGVPPLRRKTRASLCAMTYAKQLTISLRCDPHLFAEPDTRQLLGLFLNHVRKAAALDAPPNGPAKNGG